MITNSETSLGIKRVEFLLILLDKFVLAEVGKLQTTSSGQTRDPLSRLWYRWCWIGRTVGLNILLLDKSSNALSREKRHAGIFFTHPRKSIVGIRRTIEAIYYWTSPRHKIICFLSVSSWQYTSNLSTTFHNIVLRGLFLLLNKGDICLSLTWWWKW